MSSHLLYLPCCNRSLPSSDRPSHSSSAVYDVEVNREIPIHLLRTLLGSSLRDAKFESVMNLHQFLSLLEAAESFLGRTFDDLDSLRTIREGNTMLPSSSNFEQRSAMYGRILPLAALRMFRYALNLSEDDRFVDVGHGLGLVPIQASYMFGCNSCGIELLPQRYSVSLQVLSSMVRALQGQHTSVGEVTLFHGSFVSSHDFRRHLLGKDTAIPPPNHPKHSLPVPPVKMFCNNFNAAFAERSQLSPHELTLDYHLGVLFALTPPGSKLVTLHPLSQLPPSVDECRDLRKKAGLNPPPPNCSFYKYESMSLGPACDCVSWSHGGSCTEPVILHVYERVGEVHPTFMCCERDCLVSRDGMVLNALKHVDSLTHFETCCRTFPRRLRTRHPVDHMIPNLSL
jgi:hypothetical protein